MLNLIKMFLHGVWCVDSRSTDKQQSLGKVQLLRDCELHSVYHRPVLSWNSFSHYFRTYHCDLEQQLPEGSPDFYCGEFIIMLFAENKNKQKIKVLKHNRVKIRKQQTYGNCESDFLSHVSERLSSDKAPARWGSRLRPWRLKLKVKWISDVGTEFTMLQVMDPWWFTSLMFVMFYWHWFLLTLYRAGPPHTHTHWTRHPKKVSVEPEFWLQRPDKVWHWSWQQHVSRLEQPRE